MLALLQAKAISRLALHQRLAPHMQQEWDQDADASPGSITITPEGPRKVWWGSSTATPLHVQHVQDWAGAQVAGDSQRLLQRLQLPLWCWQSSKPLQNPGSQPPGPAQAAVCASQA